MKFFLILDKEKEPSVTVVCDKVTPMVEKMQALCLEYDENEAIIYGYADEEIIPLPLADVACFFTKESKVFAVIGDREYAVKLRVKQVEELVDDSFIKINQGCIINVNQVEKFAVSFGGALKVVLKNGRFDYVSRREVKNIKRRFGL